MSAKRKKNPNQPELPIEGIKVENGHEPKSAAPAGNGKGGTKGGNGETHVLAENVAVPAVPQHPFKPGKIDLAFHRRVDRYGCERYAPGYPLDGPTLKQNH